MIVKVFNTITFSIICESTPIGQNKHTCMRMHTHTYVHVHMHRHMWWVGV